MGVGGVSVLDLNKPDPPDLSWELCLLEAFDFLPSGSTGSFDSLQNRSTGSLGSKPFLV